MTRLYWILVALPAFAWACGVEDSETEPARMTPDAGFAPTCADLIPFDQDLMIDETNDSRTQIHGAAAFTSDVLWVTYNRPRPDSKFEVYASAFNCDGSKLFEAMRVTTSTTRNDIEPQIMALDDRVMILWQSDNSMGPYNLDLWYRIYAPDGTPMTEETRLEMTRKGVQESGNAWMPALCATDDGFVVAGSWGHSETNRFAVFAQRLDKDGRLIGEAMDANLQPDISQVWPSVGCAANGDIRLLWVNSLSGPNGEIETSLITANSTVAQTVVFLSGGTGGSAGISPDARLLSYAITVRGETDIQFLDARDLNTPVSSGARGKMDFAPILVGTSFVHYRKVRGLDNEVVYGRLSLDPLAVTDTQVLETGSAPPYSPILTAVPGGYFVGWSEGTNPNFVIKGRFFRE